MNASYPTGKGASSMDRSGVDAIHRLLEHEVSERSLPGAVVGAANRESVWFRHSVGYRQVTPEPWPMTVNTLFDLASLTKVVATTSLVFRVLERGLLRLDDLVSRFLPADFGSLRLFHLLTHTSGLPAWMDLTSFDPTMRDLRIGAVASAERIYPAGDQVLYSDLNFVLLGHILESITGLGLDRLFAEEVRGPLGLEHTGFLPKPYPEIAATETDASGIPFVGVVHDENARAAGGVLGHAGLFGTLDDLLTFGQALLRYGEGPKTRWLSPASVKALVRPRTLGLPGELRAYGYQKPHPLSSAGDLMSEAAIGHTGFTGTSLWVDFDYDVVMVMLTNRVHFGRALNAPVRLRPIFHNMVLAMI